jgi:hypothetical protein
MKFKFLVLVLSMATVSFANLSAKNAKMLSKDPSGTTFFSASDSTAQTFSRLTSTLFIPLTFKQHTHKHGNAVESHHGDQFHLKEGIYLVSFCGTFQVNPPTIFNQQVTEEFPFSFIDLALQLGSETGSEVVFVNVDSHEFPDFDTIGISSFSKVIKVDDHATLSVVVKDPTLGTSVTATTRSITIKKLK